jgi:hypothetical protein
VKGIITGYCQDMSVVMPLARRCILESPPRASATNAPRALRPVIPWRPRPANGSRHAGPGCRICSGFGLRAAHFYPARALLHGSFLIGSLTTLPAPVASSTSLRLDTVIPGAGVAGQPTSPFEPIERARELLPASERRHASMPFSCFYRKEN